jgi:PPOX class probable F420-dependent enzyme
MDTQIPESHMDLIDGPVLVTLTTLMPDGWPQSSVVWCNRRGPHILLNSVLGRQKDVNIRHDPRITILAMDPKNAYRYLEVRGEVVEITLDGAVEHISELAKLYEGADHYYGDFAPAERAARETRAIYKVRPVRVRSVGG